MEYWFGPHVDLNNIRSNPDQSECSNWRYAIEIPFKNRPEDGPTAIVILKNPSQAGKLVNSRVKSEAIELKCPLNGQYPEQMYSFVKDVKFMEQLKDRGFNNTASVTLVSRRPFYEGKSNHGIYRYFREEYSIYGDIYRPTGQGKDDEFISLMGQYSFQWNDLNEKSNFYIIEI
ncbi:hypothetical protein [Paenibacillus chibensis]|uniref:hypothetical protein n=1 Tax=Paenibacillus chibensis TaxID=59846 RepID=UPI000FDCA599|nr:hypothetical protein [Paenibacillus chibensis]MEC0369336.1 hypothetical protein [Paenibacillus chibensis]